MSQPQPLSLQAPASKQGARHTARNSPSDNECAGKKEKPALRKRAGKVSKLNIDGNRGETFEYEIDGLNLNLRVYPSSDEEDSDGQSETDEDTVPAELKAEVMRYNKQLHAT